MFSFIVTIYLCTMKLTPPHDALTVNRDPMSSTLLRLGLWIILLVVVLYVLHETYPASAMAEYFALPTLQKGLALGILLVAGGLVARLFGKGASKVVGPKNRCVICKTAIPPGAIYCRAHLRSMLNREDERTHTTRTRS